MKQKGLLLLNSVTLLFTLVMNYFYGSGEAGRASVGEISSRYETLFTPAGYAFAIWAVIYLLLIAFIGYQWFEWVKHREDTYLKATAWWLAFGNLANGLWIFAWTNDRIAWSMVLIVILLISLLVLMVKLRLEIWDAPVRVIAFVWWPICVYFGWIVVATMANFAVWMEKLNPGGPFSTEPAIALIMIGLACVVYLLLIYYRNMREAAFVGIWALIAIAAKQWHQNESIVYAALVAAFILFIYAMGQAIKNRDTLPIFKIRRGEF